MKLQAETTVFNDEKVKSKFSELIVDADGIRTEVSKKVGNTEVISRINQSAEQIKIQADKVNIEGAAIFSSGRLSQDNLDNSYDSKGAAQSAVASAIKRTQRIYYQSNSTTPPLTPGTASSDWISENRGVANTWTKKRMSYASATPYIWTCEQSENAAGTVSYTSVLLDDTTTVIDGGKIITGTLLANAVKADSGTFNTANIPNLNASKITAGDISSDRMKANAISAINADLTSATINTAHIPNLSADKIATGTISIERIPTTARNDTYITDIDSQSGIIVKAVNGRTDGSDDTKKNYIKLNDSGLDIYQGGNSVAKYGATSRVGNVNAYNIQVGDSSIDFYNNNINIASMTSTYAAGNRKGMELSIASDANNRAFLSETVHDAGYNLVGLGVSGTDDSWLILECLKRNSSHDILAQTVIEFTPTMITIDGDSRIYRDKILYGMLNDETNVAIMHIDAENNFVLGWGLYMANDPSCNTYVEGYDVILRARNKYYLGSVGGTQITSDKRLKEDIKSIGNNIRDVFMNFRPVEYRAKESADKQKHFGFIAQEVGRAFTENGVDIDDYSIVDEYPHSDNEEIYKTICYTEFIPLCVKMIQAQQKEIESLKEAIYEG